MILCPPLLSGFRKYKASLTKDQKVFVKECHQADQALPSYVSCGNTVSCFVKLFSKDPSFTAGKYNLKEEHIEKAMQKVKSDYNKSVIQHHVVDKFALSNRSVYELFSGNSPINRAFVSVERWGGRDFAVDLAYASFQDLVDELLKQDKDGAWEDAEGPNGQRLRRCWILRHPQTSAILGFFPQTGLCVWFYLRMKRKLDTLVLDWARIVSLCVWKCVFHDVSLCTCPDHVCLHDVWRGWACIVSLCVSDHVCLHDSQKNNSCSWLLLGFTDLQWHRRRCNLQTLECMKFTSIEAVGDYLVCSQACGSHHVEPPKSHGMDTSFVLAWLACTCLHWSLSVAGRRSASGLHSLLFLE